MIIVDGKVSTGHTRYEGYYKTVENVDPRLASHEEWIPYPEETQFNLKRLGTLQSSFIQRLKFLFTR